jgi:hypothetical protein
MAGIHPHHHGRFRDRGDGRPTRGLSEQNLNPSSNYDLDWFTYLFNIGTIITTGTGSQSITIMQDSAFELMQITVQGNISTGTEPNPNNIILPFTIMLTDTGTGRNLMQNPVPVNMIAGRGELPFILPETRIFKPTSTIQLQWAGYGAGTYNNIYLALIGRKWFEYKNQG